MHTPICIYTIHTYIHINILDNVALLIKVLEPIYYWDLFLMKQAINFTTYLSNALTFEWR